MSNTFGSVTSLLKVYVKTLIMAIPNHKNPYFSRMYMGMHTLADIVGGLLAASGLLFFLIPLGIQHQGSWQKLSFKTNSRIHWDIFSWLSWWVPLVLAPCSLGHSPSLCSGEPVQIGNMMTTFTNLYFLDNQYFLVDFECPHISS